MSVDPSSFRLGVDWDDDGFIAWGHNDPTQPSNLLLGAPKLAETTGAVYTGGGSFVDKVEIETVNDQSSVFHGMKTYHVDITFANEVIRIGRFLYNKQNLISDQMKLTSSVSTRYAHIWIKSATAISAGNYSWGVRTRTSNSVGAIHSEYVGSNATAIPANTWVQLRHSAAFAAGATVWTEFFFSPTSGSASNIDITNPAFCAVSHQTIFTPSTSLAAYEDITEDTLSVEWKLGTDNPSDKISQDGTLTAVLNNLTKKYLQGNSSSPLWGVLGKRHYVRLEMKIGAFDWVPKWQGIIETFEPDVIAKTTDMTAVSKVYTVSNTEVVLEKNSSVLGNMGFMEALQSLFYKNAASNPNRGETRLGLSKLSVNSFLLDGNINFIQSDVSNDPFALDFKGFGYNHDKQGFNEVLDGLLFIAPTVWIIGGNGQLLAIDFNHNASVPSDLNLDNNAVDVEYSFGEEMVNSLTINYNQLRTNYGIVLPEEKDEDDDVDSIDPTTLDRYWGRKKNIGFLDRKRFKKQIKRVALPPFNQLSFSDDVPLTSYSVDDYGLGNVPPDYVYYPYDKDKVIFGFFLAFTNLAPAPDSHKSSVAFEASTDVSAENRITAASVAHEISVKNDEFLRVRFTNLANTAGTYTINLYTVKAQINVILDEEQYTKVDEQSLSNNGYVVAKKCNYVPFLSINGFARDAAPSTYDVDYWASRYLEKYSTPVAMIRSFTMRSSIPGSFAYSFIWGASIGNDEQLVSDELNIDMRHMIIGEQGRINGSEIEVKYSTVGLGNEVTY